MVFTFQFQLVQCTFLYFFHSVQTTVPAGLVPSRPTINYTVSFPVSDVPQSQTFTLTPVDDPVPNEPNEPVRLTFAFVSDVRVRQGDEADLVIVDDDALG